MQTPDLTTTYTPATGDYLLLPYLDGKTPAFAAAQLAGLPAACPGEKGQGKTVFTGEHGKRKDITVRAVRLDAADSDPQRQMRIAVSEALTAAAAQKAARVIVPLGAEFCGLALPAQEGAILGGYRFDKYLKEKTKIPPLAIIMQQKPEKGLAQELRQAEIVFSYVNFARDLLNEPANVIHPGTLAEAMRKEGRKAGLKVTVWDEARLKREKCGGILGVGAGAPAHARPRLVIAEYRPAKAVCHLALVGKGVTFDTGGYCLKTASGQVGMKMDMGGAAMMFAAACAIARLKLPLRLSLYAPLVENDISAKAYHTTDILRMRSGLSVQVDNTDAEGRLILADALALAGEGKPDYIIDAATLTGACMVALGEDIAGVFGNDSVLTGRVLNAAEEGGEYMWQLPLHLPYSEQLKADIADCKNIGGSYGGSITAALFLRKFVPEKQKWVHIDIAGPAIKESPAEHLGKGAKGFGVKSMVGLARGLCGN